MLQASKIAKKKRVVGKVKTKQVYASGEMKEVINFLFLSQ